METAASGLPPWFSAVRKKKLSHPSNLLVSFQGCFFLIHDALRLLSTLFCFKVQNEQFLFLAKIFWVSPILDCLLVLWHLVVVIPVTVHIWNVTVTQQKTRGGFGHSLVRLAFGTFPAGARSHQHSWLQYCMPCVRPTMFYFFKLNYYIIKMQLQ